MTKKQLAKKIIGMYNPKDFETVMPDTYNNYVSELEKILSAYENDLKHIICVEIEEKRENHKCPFMNKDFYCQCSKDAFIDALSVKSLKESE